MIEIRNISKQFKGFFLSKINLSIEKGEFFALLGPTGSGKTVLLEVIAGLNMPDEGQIIINNKDVTPLKPENRNISIVYQDYALFPNMTVEENIKYGLRFKKHLNKRETEEMFFFLVDVLGLKNLLNRFPENLSGGEKQRTALARAVIVKPDILLLDEPFSALDMGTREVVQSELKKLHNTMKTTTLMVTHNFSEVFSLADKVAVIKNGTIQQTGTVEDVFKNPTSVFVAKFVGMKNIFPLVKQGQSCLFAKTVGLENTRVNDCQLSSQGNTTNVYVGLRAEDLVLGNSNLETDYQLKGVIKTVSNNGIYSEVKVEADGVLFTAYLTPNRFFELELHENKPIYLGFNSKNISYINN